MGHKTCKVPTPMEMVIHMLDKIGYTKDLYGKKVLENSCGEGNFLCEIVKRYILDARKQSIPDSLIKEGLERDIHGIEKEGDVAERCLANLDAVAEEYHLTNVNWHISQQDALSKNPEPVYQFVAGNPPYITYYNLEPEERIHIRESFSTCTAGKADYYYAFTEAALRSLAPDGRMIYLIPNNFFKNRFSDALRKFILPSLVEIEDYTTKKLFDAYLTSSAVIFCEKGTQKKEFTYYDMQNNRSMQVQKADLQGKWFFFTERKKQRASRRMGDCFQVSAPVATLLNEAYVLNHFQRYENGDFEVDGMILEREALRPAVSPKSRQRGEDQYIIFPYWYDRNGTLMKYEQAEFEQRFPGVCAYLRKYKEKLGKRKSEPNSKWFEYGRSQALAHIDQPKLLLSTLVTNQVRFYCLEREAVPYSGIYLVPKEGFSLEQAKRILMSDDFFAYIKDVGINASGNSYRISPRDICDYMFEEGLYGDAD